MNPDRLADFFINVLLVALTVGTVGIFVIGCMQGWK